MGAYCACSQKVTSGQRKTGERRVFSAPTFIMILRQRLLLLASLFCSTAHAADLSVAAYASIQEALKANPGRMIFVPAGDYLIHVHAADYAGNVANRNHVLRVRLE